MYRSRCAVVVLGVLAAVWPVNGAVVSLRWQGSSGDQVMLAASDTAVLEVVFTMQPTDVPGPGFTGSVLTDLHLRFDGAYYPSPVPAAAQDWIVSAVDIPAPPYGPPGAWRVLPFDPPGTSLGNFFLAVNSYGGAVPGNGTTFSTVMAQLTIHLRAPSSSPFDVALRNYYPLPMPCNGPADWVNTYPNPPAHAMEFTLGQGAPVARDAYGNSIPGTGRPLTMAETPEPGALAILVLAGLAALRREQR